MNLAIRRPDFVTYSCGAGILDHLSRVDSVRKDVVKLVHEVAIVHKVATVDAVPVEEVVGLLVSEADAKSADAGAELESKEVRGKDLWGSDLLQPLRPCPCGACRNQ